MLKNEIDVNEAVEKSKEVMRHPNDKFIDKFGKYESVYLGPTSNVKGAIEVYKNKDIKKALTVGSQGAYAYEIALNTDVEEIDCFDVNILQYMFFELINAAIRCTEHSEFIGSFTSQKIGDFQDYSNMLDDYALYDIFEFVEEPALTYWSRMYKGTGELRELFRHDYFYKGYPCHYEYLSEFASFYKKEEFEKLKDKLNSGELKINCHISDIVDIHNEFKGKSYDIIIFDNILQFYNRIVKLDDITKVKEYLDKYWMPMINSGGSLQLCYGFESVTASLLQMMGKKVANDTFLPDKIFKFELDKLIKSELIPQFVKKYGDISQLDFIDAVEKEHPHSKNVVLTINKGR